MCSSVPTPWTEIGGTRNSPWANTEPPIQSTRDDGNACALLHIKAGHSRGKKKKRTLLLFMTSPTSSLKAGLAEGNPPTHWQTSSKPDNQLRLPFIQYSPYSLAPLVREETLCPGSHGTYSCATVTTQFWPPLPSANIAALAWRADTCPCTPTLSMSRPLALREPQETAKP